MGATEEIAGDALFIMILKEIEHVIADIIHYLPLVSDTGCRTLTTNHTTQAIIHSYFVIKIIETSLYKVAVLVRIINLADNHDVRILRLQYSCSV